MKFLILLSIFAFSAQLLFAQEQVGSVQEQVGSVQCMEKVVDLMPKDIKDKEAPYFFLPTSAESYGRIPTIIKYDTNGQSVHVIKPLGEVVVNIDSPGVNCTTNKNTDFPGVARSGLIAKEFLQPYFFGKNKPTWADKRGWENAKAFCRKVYPQHPAFRVPSGSNQNNGPVTNN